MEKLIIVVTIFGILAVRPGWAVRLIGGPRTSAGRLEVNYSGQWGTVCDDDFDVSDATVVCKILGYGNGSVPQVKSSASYGQGSGPIWLDDVGCAGSETDIFQCPHLQPVGNNNCGHSEDVGIDCQPPFQIRLVNGGRSTEGRVEVNINGRWGTVCDDDFDTNDARVVCRMLGYTTETPTVKSDMYYGKGSDPIWLDDLACTVTETSILQCLPPDNIGQHNCQHSEDVGVDCRPSFSPSPIRLVNGYRSWAGRIEVYANGQWGTVCDDSFGVEDARVACRMLGYSSEQYPAYRESAYYGEGAATALILLDELGCQGWESSLFSCTHNELGVHDCSHSEDVGVDCLLPRGPTSVFITGPPFIIGDPKPVYLTCMAVNFVTSVFFSWSGVTCQSRITSAEFNTCIFTPTPIVNDVIISCTATNSANASLSMSSNYTLSLRYPPTSSPVITGLSGLESLVAGSRVNFTCTIAGGSPLVTSVGISCTSPGRTLPFNSTQTAGSTSVSSNVVIADLQLADNGTVCQCNGTWSTRPDLYTRRASVTLYVFADIKPIISLLTLNGAEGSLAVLAADNIPVVLNCSASGRPKPSIRVLRNDTGQQIQVESSYTSGVDTVTAIAVCQQAAIYTCEAINRAGSDAENIVLSVNYPPTSAPLITGLNAMEYLVAGSNVTLNCTVSGGSPLVTSVDIDCTSQGRTLTFTSTQTIELISVSRTMVLAALQLEDNGTVCQCSGIWSIQPELYTRRASVILYVFGDAEPSVSGLTLNGAEHYLTVTAGGNTSVGIRCSARGRPIPSMYIERADGRQRPVVDPPSVVVNRDESVAQTSLTTSATCEDAATYYCKASNRAGADEKSIVLSVNCAPRFADSDSLGGPAQPVIITQDSSDTPRATIHLTVHPIPTLKRVVFRGQTVQDSSGASDTQEVDRNLFRLSCEPSSTAIYRQVCNITVNQKDPQFGYYTLTIGNVFGDMSFMSKLAPTQQGENGNQIMWIAIGSTVGGFLLLAIIVVVVIVVVRKRKGDRPVHDMPAPEQQTTQDQSGYTALYFPATSHTVQKKAKKAKSESRVPQQQTNELPRYTGFPLSDMSGAAQEQDENAYENLAVEGDDPSTEYMNVGAVAGSSAGAGLQDKDSREDSIYQSM